MYSYEEFKEVFKKRFLEEASEQEKEEVRFDSLTKINGPRDTVGLCGDLGQYKGGPCIYLQDIYSHYLDSGSVEKEVSDAWSTLRKADSREIKIPSLSWEFVRDHIIFQLINRADNEAFLSGVVYREYLDLAVVYRVVMDRKAGGLTSCVVTKGLLEHLGVSEADLYEAAYHMTPILLLPRIYSMHEILCEMRREAPADRGQEFDDMMGLKLADAMWVVSDSIKQLGAYLLLFPDYFRGISEEKQDLFIIPSSIHELIVLPSAMEGEEQSLREMIHYVNENEVAPEERLSDTLYRYDCKNNIIVEA